MSKAQTSIRDPRIRARRRRWSQQQKRQIVEASLQPGASIAQVALEWQVNANQLHTWRRLYHRGLLANEAGAATLLPVRVVPERTKALPQAARGPGCIVVEFDRALLRIEGSADPLTLRVLVEALLR